MTTPLPPAGTIILASKPLQHYLERDAATTAGGTPINFMAGTLIVGDGNGGLPVVSDLVAAGGVLHEVWRGSGIVAVNPNAQNPAQYDIHCVIPATDANGVEIGPFWVSEFCITDENGVPAIVGVMAQLKSTAAANNAPSDLAWIAAVAAGVGNVVVSPPSSGFTTNSEVIENINRLDVVGVSPISVVRTLVNGIARFAVSLRAARQPAAGVAETDATGYGRPATDAEFAAGVSAGGFQWPWATLAQIKNALASVSIYGVTAPLTRTDATKKYGISNATTAAVGALRMATAAEVAARATSPTGGGPCAVRPEDIPPTVSSPWGTSPGALMFVPCYVNAGVETAAFFPNVVGQLWTTAQIAAGLNISNTLYTPPHNQGATTAMAAWFDSRMATLGAALNWKIVGTMSTANGGASILVFERQP
ncbi:MAG TPA: phage tail protein [Beijerinckiaceae bacterium]|mgnify:CR=1 FL=1|nr:phage tail protein [Rhodoblastus sp.]HRY03648.1 phage tail protein [Beijerinckiaceae bacterium]